MTLWLPTSIARRVAIVALVLPATDALADSKAECSNAYDQTQFLRKAGQLQAARKQAEICSRSTCAEFVRNDCSSWMAEIDVVQPTLVVEARDESGTKVTDVTVTVDGTVWLTTLDGASRALDPGSHQFVYEREGSPRVERTVEVREGEKNKKVTIRFASKDGSSTPPTPTTGGTGDQPGADIQRPSPAPWIIAAVGGGLVVVGAILGGVVVYERSVFDDHCSEKTQTCDADGIAAGAAGRVLGPLTTVTLVAGGAAVATGLIWGLARGSSAKASPAAAIFMPLIWADGYGGVLGATW